MIEFIQHNVWSPPGYKTGQKIGFIATAFTACFHVKHY